jgi:hypothetical protein
LCEQHERAPSEHLTHDYPAAEATRIFDAIVELHRVSVKTLRDVRDFAAELDLVIPGIS